MLVGTKLDAALLSYYFAFETVLKIAQISGLDIYLRHFQAQILQIQFQLFCFPCLQILFQLFFRVSRQHITHTMASCRVFARKMFILITYNIFFSGEFLPEMKRKPLSDFTLNACLHIQLLFSFRVSETTIIESFGLYSFFTTDHALPNTFFTIICPIFPILVSKHAKNPNSLISFNCSLLMYSLQYLLHFPHQTKVFWSSFFAAIIFTASLFYFLFLFILSFHTSYYGNVTAQISEAICKTILFQAASI